MPARTRYVVLLRGINVGGKNKLPMAKLRAFLEDLGFADVATYIQSGNAVLTSTLAAKTVARKIETGLGTAFKFDTALIKVLVLSAAEVKAVIAKRPKGFGDEPGKHHSDVVFLIDLPLEVALTAFSPLDGVDTLWSGTAVIYHQRLSAQRTRSHLSRVVASPHYKSMTIRNWNTTTKLAALLAE